VSHVGEPDPPLCRDCAFARPTPSRRAIGPLGVKQWEFAKCFHPEAMQDEDTADLLAKRLTGGKGRKAKAETSQCNCSTMRRFDHLCGSKGVHFVHRKNRLPPPMTVVAAVTGAIIYPAATELSVTELSVFAAAIGGISGFTLGLLFRRSD
jgi:hypothetical protein